MNPYSKDLRKRIIQAREKGQSAQEVAKRFELSKRSVERYWKSYRTTGHCESKKIGGYRTSRLEPHQKKIQKWIEKQSDLTLRELQDRCEKSFGLRIGLNALWHRLDRWELSYKKNSHRRRVSTGRYSSSS